MNKNQIDEKFKSLALSKIAYKPYSNTGAVTTLSQASVLSEQVITSQDADLGVLTIPNQGALTIDNGVKITDLQSYPLDNTYPSDVTVVVHDGVDYKYPLSKNVLKINGDSPDSNGNVVVPTVTSIGVTSSNSTITQIGNSVYDPVLKKISLVLNALPSGMANPMTTAGDLIIGGTPVGGVAPPVRLPKGTPGQALTVDSLGAVKYDTVSNTKYDFIVTGQNTPTFAAGEEYILYPSNIGGYVEFELTFLGEYKAGATTYGEVTAKFSIERNSSVGYYNAMVKLLSLNKSIGTIQNLTNLLSFTAYLTTAPYVINGVTIPLGQIVYTIKLNNALTLSGTTNSIFAKVSSNAQDANIVMNGSLSPAVLGIVSTPVPALAMTEEGEDEMVGATAVIKADNALFQSSMNPNNFGTDPTTGLTTSTNILSASTTLNPAANDYILLVPAYNTFANIKLNLRLRWNGNDVTVNSSIFKKVVSIETYQATGGISTLPLFGTLFNFIFNNDNGDIVLKSLTAITGLIIDIGYISDSSTPVANIPLIGTITTVGTPVFMTTPWASQVGLDNTTINVNAVTGLTQVKPYFSKYKYVDPVAGLDTNIGSYNAPYKTMLYSVTNNPTGTIHVLMGQSTEAAFSIPADKTNIDIIAQGTRSALNGFTNKVTVLGTGYGSVRFQDLNFGGGLTRAATCTCGIYVYDGSIGSTGFTNSGNGYTEISQTDASNGPNNISAGTTVFYGGKVSAPTITGTGTVVTFDNVGAVNGNAAIAAAGVTLYMFETNWVAAATGHAISCVAGTVVTMQGCNFIRPNGTLASISLTSYDIQNTDFDKANSVLGTHIGNYDWYAKLGLLNADTITTATKMLVRKATGEIAEQAVPVLNQAYQFNSPAGTLYCEDDNMTPQVMTIRNVSGGMQNKQRALVATSNALSQVDQVFSLSYNAGQTLVLSGKVSIYNNALITSANYNATAQVIGKTSGGQLVNLGTSTQVTLSKTAYAYNFINFSCTDTTSTNIIAVGVRITIQYPQANDTAIVDTMYIQATVS